MPVSEPSALDTEFKVAKRVHRRSIPDSPQSPRGPRPFRTTCLEQGGRLPPSQPCRAGAAGQGGQRRGGTRAAWAPPGPAALPLRTGASERPAHFTSGQWAPRPRAVWPRPCQGNLKLQKSLCAEAGPARAELETRQPEEMNRPRSEPGREDQAAPRASAPSASAASPGSRPRCPAGRRAARPGTQARCRPARCRRTPESCPPTDDSRGLRKI